VLERFEKGAREYWEPVKTDDGVAVRYMKAFVIEPGCLQCHAAQGYKLGDIRGGISANCDAGPALRTARRPGFYAGLLALATLWVLGGAALVAWTWHDWNLVDSLRLADEDLRTGEALFRSLVDSLSFYLIRVDSGGRVQFVNAALLRLLGRKLDACVGRDPGELLTPETAKSLLGLTGDTPIPEGTIRKEIRLPGSESIRGVELVRTICATLQASRAGSRSSSGMPRRGCERKQLSAISPFSFDRCSTTV